MAKTGNKNRKRLVLGLVLSALLIGLVGAVCIYWATRKPSREEEVLLMLSSNDVAVLESALYGPVYEDIPPGPAREKAKAKVREFLSSDRPRVLRAAILACQAGRLDIVNEPGGLDLLRKAVDRYNKTADFPPEGPWERLYIAKDETRYWIGVEASMPRPNQEQD